MADALKAKGNTAFQAGNHEEAIKHFTDAIELDPKNHVLYSNRSAAHASLAHYDDALTDAQKVVELKPDWPKGYSRLGAAYHGLEDWPQAEKAYQKGLEMDSGNAQLQQGLKEAQAAKRSGGGGGGGGGGLFSDPNFMQRLMSNPKTRPYLSQPDFRAMLNNLSNNPSAMNQYLGDPRFQDVLEVGLGLRMQTGDAPPRQANGAAPMETSGAAQDDDDDDDMPELISDPDPAEPAGQSSAAGRQQPPPPRPQQAPPQQQQRAAPSPPPPSAEDEEAGERRRRQEAGAAAKEQGNAAYKAKRFDEAIQAYNEALEAWDEDISYLTNRAAVHYEKGDYQACLEDSERAVERGRELRADYKLVARALQRKGNALAKLDRLQEAADAYKKSLTEHRTADTLKRLQETEKELATRAKQSYVDLDKAAEEREKGNEAFKGQRYPDAIKHYTEALARGPPEVNPDAYKLFSNRAACYTKLGAYPEGLKDAEATIELQPDFVKGYSRKGTLQFFMKEYDKAMETYEAGLKHDPENQELKDGIMRCVEALNKINTGQASEEEMKVRREKAMADPDIQNILTDPIMRQVLQDFQENPKAAQHHLRAPQIMAKLQKLITAGIVKMA